MRPTITRICWWIACAAGCWLSAVMFTGHAEQPVLRWKQEVLRLYDATDRPVSVRWAVRKWNEAGVGIRLQLVTERDEADVVIRKARRIYRWLSSCRHENTVGCATIGRTRWWPWERPGDVVILARKPGEQDRGEYARVVAHELGHLLGLYHNDHPCSLMNSRRERCRGVGQIVKAVGCRLPARWDWLCELERRERVVCGPLFIDVQRASEIYGGRPNPRYSPWCVIRRPMRWLAWCLLPGYLPPGRKRPAYVKAGRCTEHAPHEQVAAWLAVYEDLRRQLLQHDRLWVAAAHTPAAEVLARQLRRGLVRMLKRLKRHRPALVDRLQQLDDGAAAGMGQPGQRRADTGQQRPQ